ncbi:MAG: glycosyltransferase family 39 protein [Anaerolineae bacterium]|nr:glycosyltransferase family 39 protein [Anaerolineae bacterium]
MNWRMILPVTLVVGIGAWLRLTQVGELPPGLYRDEAFYALDAVGVLNGRWALYFAANNGREPLFIYWLALFIGAMGQTVTAVRSAAAVIGILSILAIYFSGRWLFSPRIGVLAAAALAINFWHLAISRVAYRAITLPLMLCLAIGCVAWAAQNQGRARTWRMTLAGVLFGLTFYTYTSAQMLLPFGLAVGGLLWLKNGFRVNRQSIKTFMPFALGLLVSLAPLILWLSRHPDLFFNRAGQVSIFNPDINGGNFIGTLVGNVGKALGMFVTQGDRIWRHNLSLRPVFDGLAAPFFMAGALIVLWRSLRHFARPASSHSASALALALWLTIFLIPTVFAEDTPHYLRAIGALPAACLVLAIGLEAALAWLSKQGYLMGLYFFTRPFRGWVTPPALAATFILGISFIGARGDYFDNYVKQPLTGYWLEAHNVALADAVNQVPSNHALYLDQRLSNDNPALRFLAPRAYALDTHHIQPNHRANPAWAQLPQRPSTLIFDPNHDWAAARDALPHPAQFEAFLGAMAQGDKDPQARRAFVGIRITPAPAASAAPLAVFENGITLSKAFVNPQAATEATLTWQPRQTIGEDYAVFVHVLRNGIMIAQHDGSPAYGLFPMPHWQMGDSIVDVHPLTGQALALDNRTDQVLVGIYRRSDGRRLNVLDENNKALRDSVMIFPTK